VTPAEIDRLARMAASLRPDWPVQSLRTRLTGFAHAQPHRAYADTAHALVAIALDPKTGNPGRLAENGPWWRAAPGAEPERKITMGTDAVICRKCGRVREPAGDEHDCRPTWVTRETSEARALAREAAASARGEYERAMSDRAKAVG
jgi:hypothetical protein